MTRLADRGPRRAAAVLLVLWCVAIWVLSSSSDPEKMVGMPFHLNDKIEHTIAYGTGGFLAAWAAASPVRRLRTLCVGVVFCGLWGISDEIHQSFVPGRDCSAFDLCADVLGGTLGSALAVRIVLGRRAPAAQTM